MRDNQPIIKSIELKNFKCHSSFKEDLNCLTILAGENSAGKSSVIQSILLFDAVNKSIDDTIFTLNVHGLNLGIASGIVSESEGSNDTDITLWFSDAQKHIKLSTDDIDDVSFKIVNNDDLKSEYSLFYINAERLGPKAYNDISSSSSIDVGTHGENTIYVIDQISKLIRTEYKDNNALSYWKEMTDDKLSGFTAIVEYCLKEIIPGTKLNIKTDTEQGTAAIRFSNGIGNGIIPTATGFGITYVLPIIVQSLVSLLFPNTVLIVENPEAHLHPYSQSQLGHFLAKIASYGTQVIIETHSEHIINGCRLELAKLKNNDIASIIFFNRDLETFECHHTLISIDQSGELSSWPAGFFDQSERDLLEVIKNKCKQ